MSAFDFFFIIWKWWSFSAGMNTERSQNFLHRDWSVRHLPVPPICSCWSLCQYIQDNGNNFGYCEYDNNDDDSDYDIDDNDNKYQKLMLQAWCQREREREWVKMIIMINQSQKHETERGKKWNQDDWKTRVAGKRCTKASHSLIETWAFTIWTPRSTQRQRERDVCRWEWYGDCSMRATGCQYRSKHFITLYLSVSYPLNGNSCVGLCFWFG